VSAAGRARGVSRAAEEAGLEPGDPGEDPEPSPPGIARLQPGSLSSFFFTEEEANTPDRSPAIPGNPFSPQREP
jgi:hypothetical protein